MATLLVRQNKLSTSAAETVLSSAAIVDSLIVLDRRVDLITPLLTQLTYEGLLDELIGIKNCMFPAPPSRSQLTGSTAHIELPIALVNPPAGNTPSSSTPTSSTSAAPIVNVKKDAKKKYHLTAATDPLYAELRDLNFSSIGRRLNIVARRLDEDYKVREYV